MSPCRLLFFLLVALLLRGQGSGVKGKLLVPGLTPNSYVVPGDVSLGVLHKIVQRRADGGHCQPEPAAIVHSLLQICEASVFAAQQINARHDLLPNITLGLVCTDTCSNPMTGLARAVYFVEDHPTCNSTFTTWEDPAPGLVHRKVVGIIGPGYSRVAVVVSTFFGLFHIPVLGTYASSDELSDKTRYEYFLRMVPPDRFQAQAFIDIILYFNWTYVGLVYSEGSYGEQGSKFIEQLFKKNGLCMAFSHKLTVEKDPHEFDTVQDLLQAHHMARVVIWFVEGPVIARILRVYEKRREFPPHVMLLSDSAAKEIANYPYALQGSIAVDFVFHLVPGYFDYISSLIPRVNSHNKWLEMAWEHEFGCEWTRTGNTSCYNYRPEPDWYGNIRFAINYYEGTYVYAHALHTLITAKCPLAFQNKDLLSECIKGPELLETMKNSSVDILSGPIHFDENGDRLAKYQLHHYYLNEDGRQVKVHVATWEKYSGSLEIETAQLQWSYLIGSGAVGEVVHTSRGRDVFVPHSVCSYECGQRQYKIQRTPHCCWECRYCRSNERLALNRTTCTACADFTWPDEGSGETCLPITPDYLKWDDQIAMCLSCFAVIGALVTGAFFVVFWQHRQTKLIKATNRELTFIMLLGAFLAFLMVLAFIAKPTKGTCFIRDIGFNAVVTLLYAPLLVKTLKIYCIFKAGKKGKKTPKLVSSSGQRLMIAVAFFLQMCILTGVSTTSPSDTMQRMPVITKPYVELTCVQELVSFLLPLAYNVIFILVCGALGYGSRKLPENFNESGFIFVSVSTTFFAWVVFLPTYFTAYSTQNQAAILALCLLLNAYITIGCLFAPKVYALFCVDESNIKFSGKGRVSSNDQATVSSSGGQTKVWAIKVKPTALPPVD